MLSLYGYQQEIINKIKNDLRKGFKAICVVSPCGSGRQKHNSRNDCGLCYKEKE